MAKLTTTEIYGDLIVHGLVTSDSNNLKLRDTGSIYYLNIVSDSTPNLTADKNLTIDVGNVSKTLGLFADLYIGTATNTGAIIIASNDTNARSLTLEASITIKPLTSSYAVYASGSNTIYTEQYLNVSRGGTGIGSVTDTAIITGGGGSAAFKIPGPTLTSTTMTFGGAANIYSTTTSALTLDSGSTGAVNLGTNANAKTITIGNATGATSVVVNSGTAGVTFNQVAAGIFKIQASAAPTTDMVQITNTGQVITTADINALQVDYFAALTSTSEASAAKVAITNTSTATGTKTNALRVYVTGSSTSNVVTNGLKLDIAAADTGTSNAIYAGTNWDSILSYNGTTLINGSGQFNAPTVVTSITPVTSDGSSLGTSSLQWSDLFLASGGVINFANGNATITHATGEISLTATSLKMKGTAIIGTGSADGTITTNGAYDLILNTNSGTNSGSITIADAANGTISINPNGTGKVSVSTGATTGDGFTLTANSVTTGNGLAVSANALTSGSAISITTVASSLNSATTSEGLYITRSGTYATGAHDARGIHSVVTATGTVTKYAGYFETTDTGTANYGVYATASGGTANYAGYFAGNVELSGSSNLILASGTGYINQTYTGTTTPAMQITANSLTTAAGLKITTTSTARASGSATLEIASSGANATATVTAYGVYSSVSNTGTTSTNMAVYATASGASTNYSFYGANGGIYNVGTITATSDMYAASIYLEEDGNSSNLLRLLVNSGLTGNKTLTINVNDGDRTLTLNDNFTANSLTNGYAVYASADDTISSEQYLNVSRGGTGAAAFTQGSVVFAGASGVYTQDNAKFFWDNTNDRLGIGTASPKAKLHIENGVARTDTNSNRISLQLSSDSDDYRFGLQTSFTGGVTSANRTLSLQAGSLTVSTDVFSVGSERLSLNPLGGYVGINTLNPSETLHTKGNIRIDDSSGNAGFKLSYNNTSQTLDFVWAGA